MTTPRREAVPDAQSGATAALARFAVRPRDRSTGVPNTDAVVSALIDTAAVSIAAVDTDAVRTLLAWLGDEAAPGPAVVWGTGQRLAPAAAALANGTAAHALDWDDASPSMPIHPAAVLFPALVARACVAPVDTATFVEAYNVGSAVFRAVSEALPLSVHYGRGWHNTATTGRLAATAAVARVAGLDAGRTQRALGIAASTAGGALANFGTMTKPLHAGLAARDAVMAVGLAERGFTANAAQLESRGGFFALFGEAESGLQAALPERLEHWERAWVTDWVIKRYPSCYGTHRAIDAAIGLRAELGGDPRIAEVEVLVHPTGLRPLLDHRPTTGLEGKFSMEYTVARALLHGQVTLADFTDRRLADPAVQAVMDKVRVAEAAAPDAPAGSVTRYAVVSVRRTDGSVLTRRVDVSRGDARNPLSDDDLTGKALEACRAAGWSTAEGADLAAGLRAVLRDGDLTQLQEPLTRPSHPSSRIPLYGGDRP
ncbi:MmgE/PrpD family protein [Streptomyces sp. NPDC002577]